MNTKLTLRIDRQLIEAAKAYAVHRHKPLSRIVADFFAVIRKEHLEKTQNTPPAITSLRGILKESHLDETGYKQHLLDKHL